LDLPVFLWFPKGVGIVSFIEKELARLVSLPFEERIKGHPAHLIELTSEKSKRSLPRPT
jgi:hypothetical protein